MYYRCVNNLLGLLLLLFINASFTAAKHRLLKTVFICEDHPLFRQSLELMVQTADDFKLIGSAANVSDALKKLPSARPDIVLLDLNLSSGDGFEILNHLKETVPKCWVMVLTSYNDDVLAKKAKRCGASAYMLKDSTGDELLQAMKEMQGGAFITNVKALQSESDFERDAEFTSFLRLTRMEKKLLGELVKGASVADAAELLCVSENTVKNHKKNIYRKLGVNKQSELILLCQRNGLLGD
jgi:DNA-binding NarL/FixJ family response regulator